MSIFIAKRQVKRPDGSFRVYYELRENSWREGAVRQRFLGYVGKEKTLKLKRALQICKEKGIELEALKAVRGLTISY